MITSISYLYALTNGLNVNNWLYVFTVISDIWIMTTFYDSRFNNKGN